MAAYDYKILRTLELPISDLAIGKWQERKRNVSKNVDELAENMKGLGQLQSILVYEDPGNPGKYEVLTGQRRVYAAKLLGWNTIRADVLDRAVSDEEAQAISVAENEMRLQVNKTDLMERVRGWYAIYGDVKIVAEKTFFSQNKIREILKFDTLSDELKDLVTKGEVDVRTAARVEKALAVTGEEDPELKKALAKKMKGLVLGKQDTLTKAVESGQVGNIDDINTVVTAINKQKKPVELIIQLDEGHNSLLNQYANSETLTREQAAETLIVESLDNLNVAGETEE
ncbi:ParB/RepB/Spo0J family partition protein [Chloroflexota bacterium]